MQQTQHTADKTPTVQNHRHNGYENPNGRRGASSLVNDTSNDIIGGIRRRTDNHHRVSTSPTGGNMITPNHAPTPGSSTILLRKNTTPTHSSNRQRTPRDGTRTDTGNIQINARHQVENSSVENQGTDHTPNHTPNTRTTNLTPEEEQTLEQGRDNQQQGRPVTNHTTPHQQPTNQTKNGGAKITRATLRIASLNMKGGGSTPTETKWEYINQIMRDKRIGLLCLQETHLTPERLLRITDKYQRLHIINSAHPTNPSTTDGVAIVLNKYITAWQQVDTTILILGKAILVTTTWHKNEKLTILVIYAPAQNDRLNMEFWETLSQKWSTRPHPRPPDIMLGDFNIVENSIDRLPARLDPARAVNALKNFRGSHKLIDGWRQENPNTLDFTFKTRRQAENNSRSRLDRIYVNTQTYDQSREWCIMDSGISTDHKLVSVQIAIPGSPYVGKGRSTLPEHLLKNKKAIECFQSLGKDLEAKIKSIAEAPQTRCSVNNPQILWKNFKSQLLKEGKKFASKSASKLDREIKMWEDRRKNTLHQAQQSKELPFDEQIDHEINTALMLEEADENIHALNKRKLQRTRDSIAARHHLEGETNSKYDFNMNKAKRPRDTIVALKKLNTEPPEYETKSKGMVNIATEHHMNLLKADPHNLMEDDHREHVTNILENLEPSLKPADKTALETNLEEEEIQKAMSELPNGKAAGLDGISIEYYKHFVISFEATKELTNPSFNIIGILRAVFNDIETNGVQEDTNFAEGWMCPLYKKKDKTEIGNYRPITILNHDYKIFTRALTNRLTTVIPDLLGLTH